ncbi:MAG: hypothetical protein OXF74_09350 [Rhodobacteraceae bacterium]|nr:hypothetical protein [Paracoccaceae bacterium]
MKKIAILLASNECTGSLEGFPEDSQRFIDMISAVRSDWEFATIPIRDGIFPNSPTDYDGFILTGSTASANGAEPWLPQLFELIRGLEKQRIPLFGSCFGHQAIAVALGGEVGKNPFGWSIGSEVTDFVRKEPWLSDGDSLRLYSSHQEQVTRLPRNARILGINDRCPVAAFAIGRHVFTTQYHPEMDPPFIAAIAESLTHAIGDGVTDVRRQLSLGAQGKEFAEYVARFFEQADRTTGNESLERYRFAQRVAKTSGTKALEYFKDLQSLKVEQKGAHDLVSEADRAIERLIREEIAQAFPDDSIVGEEYDRVGGSTDFTWVLDPIDGTANFLRGIPFWNVVVACVRKCEVEIGVMYDPVHDELFHCRRNHGAYLNDEPIRAADCTGLGDGLVGIGTSSKADPDPLPHLVERLRQEGAMFVRNGSGAMGLCYLASGRFIAYMEDYMNAWDCIAGILLAEEAGAIVHDFDTSRMMENGGRAVLAAPGVFHTIRNLSREVFESCG